MSSKAPLNEGTPAQQTLVLQSRFLASPTKAASDAVFTKYHQFLWRLLVGYLKCGFKFDDAQLEDIFQNLIVDHAESLRHPERIEKILACLPLVKAPLEDPFITKRISDWHTDVGKGMERAKNKPSEWIKLTGAEIESQVSEFNARSRKLRFSGGHVLEHGLRQLNLELPSPKANSSKAASDSHTKDAALSSETPGFIARLNLYDGRVKKFITADFQPRLDHELEAFVEKWPELAAANNAMLSEFALVMGQLVYLLNRIQIQQLGYLYMVAKKRAIDRTRSKKDNMEHIADLVNSESDDESDTSGMESYYADPSQHDDYSSSQLTEEEWALDPSAYIAHRKAEQDFAQAETDSDREKCLKEINKYQRRYEVCTLLLLGHSRIEIAERLRSTEDIVRTDRSHIDTVLANVKARFFPPEI